MISWLKKIITRSATSQSISYQDLVTLGSTNADAGITLDADKAMKCGAFNDTVDKIAGDIGLLPFETLQRISEGRRKATEHRNSLLLKDRVNPDLTSQDWREVVLYHLLVFGKHFSYLERKAAKVVGIYPLDPSSTWTERKNGQVAFHTRMFSGSEITLNQSQVFYVKGLSFMGYSSLSVIERAALALGTNLVTEKFGARFFKQGTSINTYLSFPNKLTAPQRVELKAALANFKGWENSHGLPYFDGGAELKSMGIPPADAQWLGAQAFNDLKIYRLFHMPPHKMGDTSRSTFSNISEENIDYVNRTLLRWIIKIENEANAKLFSEAEKKAGFYTKLKVDALQRGKQSERYANYAMGLQNGFLTINKVLELEDQNTIGVAGDQHFTPLNLAPAQDRIEDKPKEKAPEENRAFDLLLQDAARRILTKEANALIRAKKKYTDDLDAYTNWQGSFYAQHEQFIRTIYTPIVVAMDKPDALNALVENHLSNSERLLESVESVERWIETRADEPITVMRNYEKRN